MKYSDFKEAEAYCLAQVDSKLNNRTNNQKNILARAKYFFKLLGNPQDKFKIIHIAGTSGKTSTAYYLYHLLLGHQFKTGLTVSPHVVDIRERIQLEGGLVAKEKFSKAVDFIKPSVEKMKSTKYGKISYFETVLGAAFHIFAQEKLDYVVVEAGIGGKFDATNSTRQQKLCVITKIGKDHTNRLGETLPEIASHKAGIIGEEDVVLTTGQKKEVLKVIQKEVEKKNAKLTIVKSQNIKKIKLSKKGTRFDFSHNDVSFPNLKLKTGAKYQIENANLALSSFMTLSKRDEFALDESNIRNAMKSLEIPGRFQISSYKDRDIILDAAHNPQKMKALVESLKALFPNEKFVFILPFKTASEKYLEMVALLKDIAQTLIVTRIFTAEEKVKYLELNSEMIEKRFSGIGINEYRLAKNANEAVGIALKTSKEYKIVATGSLFIASEILKIIQ